MDKFLTPQRLLEMRDKEIDLKLDSLKKDLRLEIREELAQCSANMKEEIKEALYAQKEGFKWSLELVRFAVLLASLFGALKVMGG